MPTFIICCIVLLLTILATMKFLKGKPIYNKWITWGVVCVFLLSWSFMTTIGALFVFTVKEALAMVPFWIFGVPFMIFVGLCMVVYGFYLKKKVQLI